MFSLIFFCRFPLVALLTFLLIYFLLLGILFIDWAIIGVKSTQDAISRLSDSMN